jgi:hypothetical protein
VIQIVSMVFVGFFFGTKGRKVHRDVTHFRDHVLDVLFYLVFIFPFRGRKSSVRRAVSERKLMEK